MNTISTTADLGLVDDQGAADALGISLRQLERLRTSGQIRWSTLGLSRRYRIRDLEALLDATARGGEKR